jgi:transposase-like protein
MEIETPKTFLCMRRKDLYSAERQLVISDELGQLSDKQKIQVRRRRSREEVERLEIEFEESGLRLMEFCRKHGVPPSTLQRHLKRRRLGNVQAKQENRLAAVVLAPTNGNKDARGACALQVVLSSGLRIEVLPDFDSGTLERLLSVLARSKAAK